MLPHYDNNVQKVRNNTMNKWLILIVAAYSYSSLYYEPNALNM